MADRIADLVGDLAEALKLALSALPDSDTAGPDATGYKYAWDELSSDEQEWVKDIRRQIAELGEG